MTASDTRHFTADYHEIVTLEDETEVVLRLVRPEDKALLVRGLQRLSERSRYLRFFAPKSALSEAELRYLTEVDGENHFAVGALRRLESGQLEGVGIARFVRRRDDPTAAEPAITVVDDFQGKGLGQVLFLRLVAAARERGIDRFRSEILPENQAMRTLLHQLAPDATEHERAGVLTIELELPRVTPAAPASCTSTHSATFRVLSLAAQGVVSLRRALGWLYPLGEDDDESAAE